VPVGSAVTGPSTSESAREISVPGEPVRGTLVELRFRAPDERARPVMAATPVSRPPLTVADDRFVGEPVAPAQPFRSLTEFDRMVAEYSAMPLDAALAIASSSAPPPAPPAEEPPPPPPPPRRQRTTLGQSRRRGLGGYRMPATEDEPPDPDEPYDIGEPYDADDAHEEHDEPADRHDDWPDHPTPPPAAPAEPVAAEHTCPDMTDTNTLDDLAGRLYRHVRTRLRTELLVDRERSGLLADPL
jgi:hypothetical protein